MANITRNFIAGKMNKMVDERLVPNGEYIDALNIRMGSTESSEIGVIENAKGNIPLTNLSFNSIPLSASTRCIGAFEDGANEKIYWFVHDPEFTSSATGKLDAIVSFDTKVNVTTYHVISTDDGSNEDTVLNFSTDYLITGVNIIENLLFFTDNYNPPRCINVNKNYDNPVNYIDQTSAESLLVIKKPPVTSPTIKSISTSSQDNFLEDRFICFAYRYRYEDGEYSATSQFSEPSFVPKPFNYSVSTALNEGMINSTNRCDVTYNSGGPLVKSVELLFKDMNNSIIKVIEKLDKKKLGLADNVEYTYNFNNSKIFTILPDSEILRLYDNVPKLAQAQTMMGNRLVYGNYLEDYDLIDSAGNSTKLEYFLTKNTEVIGREALDYNLSNGNYSWNNSQTISDSVINIDLTGIELISGSVINILIRFNHSSWSGDTPFPTEITAEETIDFNFILNQDYNSVYELATSPEFTESIGTALNIQTVANCSNGVTLTDEFNCILPNDLSGLFKYESGISAAGQPIGIISTPASSFIGLQLPAMRYVDDATGVAITQSAYEYYSYTIADINYQRIGNPTSLHSNRGYEIGIIYMDEYNRSTTALVSPENTVHVGCGDSDKKNSITVNIPSTQVAPIWATRYKFVIKPDKKDYNIIYSNLFFRDPTSGADFFLLEGQNSTKIEEGDELIVKADTLGPRGNCTWTTVLEKKAQIKDFLNPLPVDSSGLDIPIPAGTYMKLKARNFSTEVGDLPVVSYGEKTAFGRGGGCGELYYPVDIEDPDNAGSYIDYTIPAGSRITIKIQNNREGNTGSFLGNVSTKRWNVEASFISDQDYSNFKSWFDTSNIAGALESQSTEEGDMEGPNYEPTLGPLSNRPCNVSNIYTNFYNDGTRTYLGVKSSQGYSGSSKRAKLDVTIDVIRAANTIVFESDPQDAEPDLWYESSESFSIGANGVHSGNIQSQVYGTSNPAIILTNFFNCYSFGNGVESFKIQDSINGKELVLGNRATTTKSQDYKETRRFSDLTYSGVYNEESNINKLNEFNSGLLNFKALEQSFGPVMKLFARETDILTLQEDKISYVLAGKNLLSDASGGSALTSVPEVLGTQIARVEEFGISHNPESFAQWGPDKYFTDAKRGAVIQLKGSSAQSDQLQVISKNGMRTWFRDLFTESFNTQKIGGFDPYMNEYVLSSNEEQIPSEVICEDCGISSVINITSAAPYVNCFSLGDLVGNVDINYSVSNVTGTFTIDAVYDGDTFSSGAQSSSGVLTFNKDKVLTDKSDITITTTGSVTVTLTVNCPSSDQITVVLIQLNGPNDAGLFITNEYRWSSSGGFLSPLHSSQVEFDNGITPIVSDYQLITGYQGGGVIPANGADVSLISNKNINDDFILDPNNADFRYLRSNTLYNNNTSDINTLISNSISAGAIIPPTNGNTGYTSNFTMPSVGQYLYLIWDYRSSTAIDLCFGQDLSLSCCGCSSEQPEP